MLKLEIVTPEKRVLKTEVDSVTLPTASGEAGILPSHAPLISALRPGILTYTTKGSSEKLAVSGGFVEVNSNSVSVLAETAETAEEIDVEAARLARDEAEKALASLASSPLEETEDARNTIEAANVRVQLAGSK